MNSPTVIPPWNVRHVLLVRSKDILPTSELYVYNSRSVINLMQALKHDYNWALSNHSWQVFTYWIPQQNQLCYMASLYPPRRVESQKDWKTSNRNWLLRPTILLLFTGNSQIVIREGHHWQASGVAAGRKHDTLQLVMTKCHNWFHLCHCHFVARGHDKMSSCAPSGLTVAWFWTSWQISVFSTQWTTFNKPIVSEKALWTWWAI